MEPIELDLGKAEYDEHFSSQELWQRRAATALVRHLEHFGLQAKKYNASRERVHSSNNIGHNIHNSILISGSRGTGKSVFLKNAKSIWEKSPSRDKAKLFFAPLIDPTLLQDHDSFTNVIVAHIYNQVIDALNPCTCQQKTSEQEKNKQSFYEVLRKLADAIEQPGEKSEHTGLDKIIQYSSGIRIDALFYDFVTAAKLILKCDAIVLSIDDVDMALDQAYPVLEEIRRRLSCPDIIPLVSGDLGLYQHLVKIKLINSLKNEKADKLEKEDGDRISRELTEAYLTKVLPNNYRIALQPIEDLVPQLWIIDTTLSTDSKKVSYSDYQYSLRQSFFGPINGEEKSADYPQPNSAREVGQLVRLLPPSAVSCTEVQSTNLILKWESMRLWSEAKQHGAGYVLAQSAIQLIQKSEAYRLSQLIAFNVRQQADERLPWAGNDFIAEQKNLAEPFDKDKNAGTNKYLLSHSLRGNILRSMPPLEMHTDNMSITGNEAEKETNQLSLAIYTHWAYYNTQGNQQRKIFFSRAFELLGTSLLMATTQSGPITGDTWKNQFLEVLNSSPFYSIHKLNPTKPVEETSPSDEGNTGQVSDEGNSVTMNSFANDLVQWVNEYKDDVQAYLADPTHLISLLSAVFNKAFSQLDLLRRQYHKGTKEVKEDQLLDAILRFRYILTNAFGFFIKQQGVVPANLALTTSQGTLRKMGTYANYSSTYKINVSWINTASHRNSKEISTEEDTKHKTDSRDQVPYNAHFLKAILNHPIFVGLGVDIDNCSDVTSAKITNSSGGSSGGSDSKDTEKSSAKITKPSNFDMDTITAFINKTEGISTVTQLKDAIEQKKAEVNLRKELWVKIKHELEGKDVNQYKLYQRNILKMLNGEFGEDENG
ncbi:hypothetical protein FM037_03390 [Shewanella psychropiezotolerans]|uniref:ATP-binding protein n=1 Tax=Shewanella psychropiezotolerans TaxID=2593655 RepID=A0ABX5WZN7_9GAMM|nr:hypothetical protein [Shewanella psychropiezotolerans]QDO82461.1 hypothetical protein FM037_03390 [Shewanella psychropiezotolerans]